MLKLIIWLSLLYAPSDHVSISISEGIEAELPEHWQHLDSIKSISIGKSYWAKVDLHQSTDQNFVLQGGNWYMKNIHFYDSEHQLISIGNSLLIEPNEHNTYYLFYPFHDEKDPDHFSISLHEQVEFLNQKRKNEVFQSAFHAILLFLILVSLFFVLRSKDRTYLHYALYLGSILIFFSYQYGLLGSIIPVTNSVPPTYAWIFSASLSFCYLLFAQSFLQLKKVDPFNYKISYWGQLYISLIVVIETISYLLHFDILHQVWYKTLLIGIQVVLMVFFTYRIFKLKTLLSHIFLAGVIVLVMTTLTGQVASTFKLQYETNQLVQIGLLLDVFILSIGISVRVDLIQRARNEAQSKLINQMKVNEKLQLEYTEKLESKVTQRTSALNQRNKENVTLLKEVHHRVKNNLQMIISLLNMQQRRLKEKAAKDSLTLTKNRVKSIGLIHEHLYKHDDFSRINLRIYTEELCFIIVDSLHKGQKKIKSIIEVDDVMADINTAIPVGLILNELITNSIKYGFLHVKQPLLKIKIYEKDSSLILIVRDNGEGISEMTNSEGFGNIIITALLDNHDGEIKYEKDDDGFQVKVLWKDYRIEQSEVHSLDPLAH